MGLRSTDVSAASGKRQHVWALTNSFPSSSHSKRAGGGTAASVNTSQSAEWVTHDLGLTGVCRTNRYLALACDSDRVCEESHMERSHDHVVIVVCVKVCRGQWWGGTVKGDACVHVQSWTSFWHWARRFDSDRSQEGGQKRTQAASVGTIYLNDPSHPPHNRTIWLPARGCLAANDKPAFSVSPW